MKFDPVYTLRAILLGILLGLILFMAAGCSSMSTPITLPVSLPDRPNLPTISKDELACTSPETRERLVLRESLLKDYAQQLELVANKLSGRN